MVVESEVLYCERRRGQRKRKKFQYLFIKF